MPLLPSVVTSSSGSLINARRRALELYKLWYKAAPDVVELYYLDIPTRRVRQRIRQEFEKNRDINDVNVIDVLLFKGRIELEETINQWKQITHVLQFFEQPFEKKPETFMEKFLKSNSS
ncbi:NADH dehydrogenase, alpha subcomplex, subunit 6 [Cladochytrium replicatum]|nr:NADH dehydrogenase, alpha subcomplex, subunit 6 [Cladochytrium replicatum]